MYQFKSAQTFVAADRRASSTTMRMNVYLHVWSLVEPSPTDLEIETCQQNALMKGTIQQYLLIAIINHKCHIKYTLEVYLYVWWCSPLS